MLSSPLELSGMDFQPASCHWQSAFRKKFDVSLDTSRYRLRTLDDLTDLIQVFRMRHDIYCEEYRRDPHPTGLDWDEYDWRADHLVVEDRRSGEIVATYRLLSSRHTQSFYSETEFDLSLVRQFQGNRLELGRACVRADHRNGVVLTLLWKGIGEYVRASGASLIFGCSSIPSTDPLYDAAAVDLALSAFGAISDEFAASPKPRIPGLREVVSVLSHEQSALLRERGERLIPPLLKLYLKAGGKVSREPFYDSDFRCLDYFTALKTWELADSFQRRFLD